MIMTLTLLSGCFGSSEDHSTGDENPIQVTPSPSPSPSASPGVQSADISGSITSMVSTASGSATFKRRELSRNGMISTLLKFSKHWTTQEVNSCDSGTYSGAYVGGGGTEVVSGTFQNGEFTIPQVETKKELIITFHCHDTTTQRCLVKSGDEGIQCNPVADAVIAAFENGLGKTVFDSSFVDKSIAKVGSAIVEAAQNDSTAADAFNAAIAACCSPQI